MSHKQLVLYSSKLTLLAVHSTSVFCLENLGTHIPLFVVCQLSLLVYSVAIPMDARSMAVIMKAD